MHRTLTQYRDHVISGFVKAVQPIVIERAHGSTVIDTDGREYIDLFAGISVSAVGHCHPEVIEAAQRQMERLIHCCSYMYHAQPVGELAEKLAQITPNGLSKTFFGSSGAEAVETALKLAKLATGRHEFIALQSSFHGRTLATLSVTGNAARKRRGGPFVPGVAFAPAPSAEVDWDRTLEEVIRHCTSGDVAAFLAEPVLGEGGMIVPPKGAFKEIKRVLDRHGILFICDEVQTSFGRTGAMFAIEHYGVEPDMLISAKGIANGFPLSALTARPEIADSFRPGEHLSTFGGNPVSCAASLATIRIIERDGLVEKSARDGEYALDRLRPLIGNGAADVRGKGLMVGVEMADDAGETGAQRAERVRDLLRERGVLVGVGGATGNVVRIQPPLMIERDRLDRGLDLLAEVVTGRVPARA